MIKPSVNLQELRRRIYRKAKAEKQWRFWGLYAHVTKRETLIAAYREAKANDGSPGIDGESFESIEIRGRREVSRRDSTGASRRNVQAEQEPAGRDSQGKRQDPSGWEFPPLRIELSREL